MNIFYCDNTGAYVRRLAIRHMGLYMLVHFMLLKTDSKEVWNLQKLISKTKQY